MLGVLGGMGPMATVDFMRKLTENTEAVRDQDHLPVFIYSATHVPDRTAFILGQEADPFPDLRAALALLEAAGADVIAIPCNTAHYWHAALQAETRVRILHIVDGVAAELARRGAEGETVALLATDGTVKTGLYQNRLAARGFSCIVPDPAHQEAVMRGIYLVKAGRMAEAEGVLQGEAEALRRAGCRQIVMGCTEIPLALEGSEADLRSSLVDATEALARLAIEACRKRLALR
jgi:aspartate racemase